MTWETLCIEAYQHFSDLVPSDLVAALRHRFEVEHISRYFRSLSYSFSSETLTISTEDSILIEFVTLQAEHPELYPAKQYRLLLVLGLHNAHDLSREIELELNTARRKDNIDRIVLWTCSTYKASLRHALKAAAIDVIEIDEGDMAQVASLSHYIPVAGRDHDYAVTLNLAADLLLKRLKKMFHLVLSEVAAPIYDRLYGKAKFATDAMMKYEERLVRATIAQHLPAQTDRRIAVDVGCGTGRHTFPLAKQFERVYAFDFSPRMIAEADQKKAASDIRNVLFSTADLEYESVRDEEAFFANGSGSVDLIVASFGLGSFIENTAGMVRRFQNWLRDDGIAIISFYNSQTILLEVTPNWRDTSLSAHLDTDTNTLRVELSPRTVFHIYCKPYSPEVQRALADKFEVLQVTTFPTLMALMPNGMLQTPKALGLFRFLDETLAEHPDYRYGHYVTVVLQKRPTRTSDALPRVRSLIEATACQFEAITHPPVMSFGDVRRHLEMADGLAVKTLLFRRRDSRRVIVVVVPARLRVDVQQIAKHVGASKLYFASDRDVIATGFPLGGVAPIGFLPETTERLFVHAQVLDSSAEWVYTGSGDNRTTLKIRTSDFITLLRGYEPILC